MTIDEKELLFELFSPLPRQGPGCTEATVQAYRLIPNLPLNPHILDVGCGKGVQTLLIAQQSNGVVTGIDIFQPFLDHLANEAKKRKLNITTVNASMDDLPFDKELFHLIWAEGSIFIMGFENGLKYWNQFIKPYGYVALTELCYIKENPPEELVGYWKEAYPGIKYVKENIEIIEKNNYKIIDIFVIPDRSWWDDLYTPLKDSIIDMREKYKGNEEIQAFLDMNDKEIEMREKYSEWYGYVFFILQKV